jgi:hypothetical protein
MTPNLPSDAAFVQFQQLMIEIAETWQRAEQSVSGTRENRSSIDEATKPALSDKKAT